jgi:hypothetical protein
MMKKVLRGNSTQWWLNKIGYSKVTLHTYKLNEKYCFDSNSNLCLFIVNFSLLLNIAENIKVEDKIRRRNIVAMLVQCLERSTVPLLCVVAKFLTKLSLRVENKDEMVIEYYITVVNYFDKLLH